MVRRRSRAWVVIPVFLITLVVAFVVVMLIKTGKLGSPVEIFKSGTITYDSSLTDAEQDFLKSTIGDKTVKSDLTISAKTQSEKPKDQSTLVYDILVPVTDFYSPKSNITSAEAGSDTISEISIRKLENNQKLLSVDGYYFLDDFERGASFRTFSFTGNDPEEIIDLVKSKIDPLPEKETTLSFAQTGTTAISRAMLLTLAKVGGNGAYFAENIKDFLSSKDLTHISNEVSFADNCPGGTNTTVLCSDWRALESLKSIGVDIVELTGNHNNDYGHDAYFNTVKKYEELSWKTFGGGKDEKTAEIPLEISEKGAKITLIGVNKSSSTKANGEGANGSNPGANIYDETLTKQQIKEAKDRGDFVIVDVQFSECYCYPDGYVEMPACDAPITGQETFFKNLIDFGADTVIGTQAHQPQTYELYKNKPIYYGLGNLFFDQTYWPGTERGIILTHYFVNGKYIQTRFSPTIYGAAHQVQLMDDSAAESFINRLNNAR